MAVVYSNYYGSAFFAGGFFGPGVEDSTRTGGKGDNQKRRRNLRSNIIKPTGLVDRPKSIVEKRLQQSQEIAAEIAREIAAPHIEPGESDAAKTLFAKQELQSAFDIADRTSMLRDEQRRLKQREEDEELIAIFIALAADD